MLEACSLGKYVIPVGLFEKRDDYGSRPVPVVGACPEAGVLFSGMINFYLVKDAVHCFLQVLSVPGFFFLHSFENQILLSGYRVQFFEFVVQFL